MGDSFNSECYFAAWLVSQGKETWETILEQPMVLTNLINKENTLIENYQKFTHELFSYVPYEVLEEKGYDAS